MNYWLFKSEPDVFSIDHLKRDRLTHWDGVRNYQVRNMMRDDIRPNDLAFFYHSSCKVPGIVGVMKIVSTARPDPSALDPASDYFDAKSHPDNPTWLMLDVEYQRHMQRIITLAELRAHEELHDMILLRKGNRLSITAITKTQWHFILRLEHP